MAVRLIVSDIDGTFLGKSSRMVPENLEAIEYFKKDMCGHLRTSDPFL